MTSLPVPIVRSMIVCEELIRDPWNPKRLSLINVIHSIRSNGVPAYPLRYQGFDVFMQLSECRGKCKLEIRIRAADTDAVVFQTKSRIMQAPNTPLLVQGLYWRIRKCTFPSAGLYWVQFWIDDQMLAQQPIVLR